MGDDMSESNGEPPTYGALPDPQRVQMVQNALIELEERRFEAELNATMSDDGENVELPILGPQGQVVGKERAKERIARLDRQLERLRATYGELIRG